MVQNVDAVPTKNSLDLLHLNTISRSFVFSFELIGICDECFIKNVSLF